MDSTDHNSIKLKISMILLALTLFTNFLTTRASFCRLRNNTYPPQDFYLRACAICYKYIMSDFFNERLRVVDSDKNVTLVSLKTKVSVTVTSLTELEALVSPTFKENYFLSRWDSCCSSARECCQKMANASETEPGQCPMTWDGWLCWPASFKGSVEYLPCPPLTTLSQVLPTCPNNAEKVCEDHIGRGIWKEQTNYTPCSKMSQANKRIYVSIGAFAISAAFLGPALTTFSIYSQLQVHRITLHKNLFLSLLFYAVFEIIFLAVEVLPEESVIDRRLCTLLVLMTQYFRCSNFLWMFCEGFYLHRLLSSAFSTERSLLVFYIIGWVMPLVPVSIYSTLRMLNQKLDVEICWKSPLHDFEWVLYVPNLLSLLVNTLFLVHIIIILVSKLQAHNHREPTYYRKAVKGTLVLIPLFGLNFVVALYRVPNPSCHWETAYTYMGLLLDGLQGAVVAINFCYLNREVITLVKRSYNNLVQKYNPGITNFSRSSVSTQLTQSAI